MENFLTVDKNLLGKGLQPIDILIMAQIQEFERANECYVTNQQFADWFGVSTKTVERALDRLEKLEYISRDTKTVNNNGQQSKQRKIKATDKMTLANEKQPSFCPKATDNLSKSNRQNDVIKENLKENLKDNLSKRKTKKRRLEDLSDDELDNLEYDYKSKVKYAELYKKYNLTDRIDNTLLSKIFEIKKNREREYRKLEANERLLNNDENFFVNPNKAKYVRKTEECIPELESLWYI